MGMGTMPGPAKIDSGDDAGANPTDGTLATCAKDDRGGSAKSSSGSEFSSYVDGPFPPSFSEKGVEEIGAQ